MDKAITSDMLSRQDVSSARKESPRLSFIPRPLEILVVDDDADLRRVVVRVLQTAGYRVQEAANGVVAQQLLGDSPPALVLTDLWMPGGDGWELLLHCQSRWPLTPVLLMSSTALGLHPDIECWAAGFLPKPFEADQLLSEVGRLAARRTYAQNPAGLGDSEPAG